MNEPWEFIFKRKRNFYWSFFVFTVPLESLTLSRYLRLKFPSKVSNVNLYWNERDWPQRELENSKFHLKKLRICYQNFIANRLYSRRAIQRVVDVHISHFGKCVKNIVPKIVENSPKTHYFFYTLPKMRNMDIDHSLDSSSWVQSICNKILITNSQFFQMKFWIF